VANLLVNAVFFLEYFLLPIRILVMAGLSGIVGLTIGDFFAFRMYAILSPRTGSVLTTLSPAAALVAGYFLLGETINGFGIAGMVITMIGVMGISLEERKEI
jgi:drug/metabolite transporter (DMT)-like permease